MDLVISDLHSSLSSASLDKGNLLNEISKMYPDAISFSSGSPCKGTYDVEGFSHYLEKFIEHMRIYEGQSLKIARISILNLM